MTPCGQKLGSVLPSAIHYQFIKYPDNGLSLELADTAATQRIAVLTKRWDLP